MKFTAALLFCITATAALATNESSDRLLGMPEATRNAFWSRYFKLSKEKCDRVVRSIYQGRTAEDYDVWSIQCADRSAYVIGVEPGAKGDTRLISCLELETMTQKLTARFGSALSHQVGCFQPLP